MIKIPKTTADFNKITDFSQYSREDLLVICQEFKKILNAQEESYKKKRDSKQEMVIQVQEYLKSIKLFFQLTLKDDEHNLKSILENIAQFQKDIYRNHAENYQEWLNEEIDELPGEEKNLEA